MENLSPYLIQEIFYFLNIDSLQECSLVRRKWRQIVTKDSFWKLKFQKNASSYFHSGPYFQFPEYKSILETLNAEKFPVNSFKEMKSIAQKLENPQCLTIKHIEASSEDFDQVSTNLLTYDDLFWSSKQNDSKDSDEFLVCELQSESLIFSVSFKTYRAIYQEGTIYPPMFVKLSVGSTKECNDFETEKFEVALTENYNTISVLPNLLSGKFVKLHLLGKQSQEPGTEKWYTVLRFIEIVGHPIEDTPDPLLKLCRNQQFEKISNNLSPFYFERIEKFGGLANYFKQVGYLETDISCYLFEINKDKVQRPEMKNKYCEILGNYFFEKGEYENAKQHYSRVLDIWGYTKVSIVLKQFQNVRNMMYENCSRRPGLAWVLKTAKTFGGDELEKIVIEEFKERN